MTRDENKLGKRARILFEAFDQDLIAFLAECAGALIHQALPDSMLLVSQDSSPRYFSPSRVAHFSFWNPIGSISALDSKGMPFRKFFEFTTEHKQTSSRLLENFSMLCNRAHLHCCGQFFGPECLGWPGAIKAKSYPLSSQAG